MKYHVKHTMQWNGKTWEKAAPQGIARVTPVKTSKPMLSKKGRLYRRIHHRRKIMGSIAAQGIIKGKERKIFNYLSDYKQPTEYGGAIDFDKKGRMEQFEVIPGQKYGVYLPDFEALYHTHPDKDDNPPSPEDIHALLKNKNQQAEIVFRDGTTFTVIKTQKTKELARMHDKELKALLEKTFRENTKRGFHGSEARMKEAYERLGFNVQVFKKSNKTIRLKLKPFEPKKRFGSLDSDITRYAHEAHVRLHKSEELKDYLLEQNRVVEQFAKDNNIHNLNRAYFKWVGEGYAKKFANKYKIDNQ